MAAQQTATSEGDFSSAFARIQGYIAQIYDLLEVATNSVRSARKTQHNYMKK